MDGPAFQPAPPRGAGGGAERRRRRAVGARLAGVGPAPARAGRRAAARGGRRPPPGRRFEAFMAPAGARSTSSGRAPAGAPAAALTAARRGDGGGRAVRGATEAHRGEELELAVEQAAEGVAIVVVGTTEHDESEGFDAAQLALPGGQDELVEGWRPPIGARSSWSTPGRRAAAVARGVGRACSPGSAGRSSVMRCRRAARQHEHGRPAATTWPGREQAARAVQHPGDGVLAYDEGTLIGYRAGTPRRPPAARSRRFWFGHGWATLVGARRPAVAAAPPGDGEQHRRAAGPPAGTGVSVSRGRSPGAGAAGSAGRRPSRAPGPSWKTP